MYNTNISWPFFSFFFRNLLVARYIWHQQLAHYLFHLDTFGNIEVFLIFRRGNISAFIPLQSNYLLSMII